MPVHAREPHPEAPAVAAPVFVARGLTKVYRMGEVQVQALRGIDLDIFASEFVVLLGPSGCGKSTLLNILGGLDRPTAGAAMFRDHDLTHASEAELTRYRRQHVGFVFQFYNLIPSLTAIENVTLVTDMSERPMRPQDALALVGLGDQFRIDARIVVFERRDAVIAPVAALFRDGEHWAVYVASDGRAHKRRVKVGGRTPSDAWIEEGLSAAERVVVYPGDSLADGKRLTTVRGPA